MVSGKGGKYGFLPYPLGSPHRSSSVVFSIDFLGPFYPLFRPYIFYVPHKHLVISQHDAVFNQACFPARVGDTMLVDKNTITIGNSDEIPSTKTVGDKPPNENFLENIRLVPKGSVYRVGRIDTI